jgi:hypothetical protein
VVRCDGHAQTFTLLLTAEIRAEEWAKETGHVVDIWSRWTWQLIETVHPDGTRAQPAAPVYAGFVGRDTLNGELAIGVAPGGVQVPGAARQEREVPSR